MEDSDELDMNNGVLATPGFPPLSPDSLVMSPFLKLYKCVHVE